MIRAVLRYHCVSPPPAEVPLWTKKNEILCLHNSSSFAALEALWSACTAHPAKQSVMGRSCHPTLLSDRMDPTTCNPSPISTATTPQTHSTEQALPQTIHSPLFTDQKALHDTPLKWGAGRPFQTLSSLRGCSRCRAAGLAPRPPCKGAPAPLRRVARAPRPPPPPAA